MDERIFEQQPLRFPLIDVLRGFAAISVLVYHVIEHFKWTSFPTHGPLLWFRMGGFGVDLFFVISGFVISLSVLSRVEKTSYREFFASFFQARLARIVPLYVLTCLVFVVFCEPALLFQGSTLLHVASHASFLHSWFVTHHGSINGVNWSVAVEMQFYLLVALMAPLLIRGNLILIVVVAIVTSWVWRFTVFGLDLGHGPWGNLPVFIYTTQLPGMLDEFAIGFLLARLMCGPYGRRIIEGLRRWPWVMPSVSIGLTCLWLAIYLPNAEYWNSVWMVTSFRTLLALAWGALILAACAPANGFVMLLTKPLRYFGTVSYGIYLWHLPVILSLDRLSWLDGASALPWIMSITLGLASFSWYFLEKPIIERFAKSSRVPKGNDIPVSNDDREQGFGAISRQAGV